MPVDFDVKEFCLNLQATKAPYYCPVRGCAKRYLSSNGLQSHMLNVDHDAQQTDEGTPHSGRSTPLSNRKRRRKTALISLRKTKKPVYSRPPSPAVDYRPQFQNTNLTYEESQRIVEVDISGKTYRIDIHLPLSVDYVDPEPVVEDDALKPTNKDDKSPERPHNVDKGSKFVKQMETPTIPRQSEAKQTVPEAHYRLLTSPIQLPEIGERNTEYYKHVGKSDRQLDEEIEYDMDEEDHAWLEIINGERQKKKLSMVGQDLFEGLMDRLEKESYFESCSNGNANQSVIDEDAVCNICNDGECANSNVILFCDMCNLPVHQECYGVPYIPEGQWLCRRCLQSPSRGVDCVLCPNKGGAFKQTDDGRWAHVVCALWVPEVCFANSVFLEPIDSIKAIPPARWRLNCYICRQRGSGACIQCHKGNCYTAFHVTCAQQANLHMKMEQVSECELSGGTVAVRKTAYCDLHTPVGSECKPIIDSTNDGVIITEEKRKQMRQARRTLAEKRSAVPLVSIPFIPPSKIKKILIGCTLQKKDEFMTRLQAYWLLKRQSRNGVPLLRRLQTSHGSGRATQVETADQSAYRSQLRFWKRLRQDLERSRLLVELIRKREKLKREQMKVKQLILDYQLQPFSLLLKRTLDLLQAKDTQKVFVEAVDPEAVPDYYVVVSEPMDFAEMRRKVEEHEYVSFDQFEHDFGLIVDNCLTYNNKDTMYYRCATFLREKGGAIVRHARRLVQTIGVDEPTGMHREPIAPQTFADRNSGDILDEIDSALNKENRDSLSLKEQLKVFLDLLDRGMIQGVGIKKNKRLKVLRIEIGTLRRRLAQERDRKLRELLASRSETESDSRTPSPKKRTSSTPKKKRRTPASCKKDEGMAQSVGKSVTDSGSEASFRVPLPAPLRIDINPYWPQINGSLTPRRSSRKSPANRNINEFVYEPPTRRSSSFAVHKAALESRANAFTSHRGAQQSGSFTGHQAGLDTDFFDSYDEESEPGSGPASPVHRTRRLPETAHLMAPYVRGSGDSFTRYRNERSLILSNSESEMDRRRSSSDSDEESTGEESGTDGEDEVSNLSGKTFGKPRLGKSAGLGVSDLSEFKERAPQPLDIVWAKCRGYPSYPALVIDPEVPRMGVAHNGVPIAVPPLEVLARRPTDGCKDYYLVLFFDTKRTWQWLPADKLCPFGIDASHDKARLLEGRHCAARSSVKGAYSRALEHMEAVADPGYDDDEVFMEVANGKSAGNPMESRWNALSEKITNSSEYRPGLTNGMAEQSVESKASETDGAEARYEPLISEESERDSGMSNGFVRGTRTFSRTAPFINGNSHPQDSKNNADSS